MVSVYAHKPCDLPGIKYVLSYISFYNVILTNVIRFVSLHAVTPLRGHPGVSPNIHALPTYQLYDHNRTSKDMSQSSPDHYMWSTCEKEGHLVSSVTG